MTAEPRTQRLAVLIDGENVSANYADYVFRTAEGLGDVCVRRVYGDFTNDCHKAWREIVDKHGVQLSQQFVGTPGKNVTDLALAIDAMDLLHAGRLDGICIASSDRELGRVVTRAREQGLKTYVFGRAHDAVRYRNAHGFFDIAEHTASASASYVEATIDTSVTLLQQALHRLDAEGGWVNPAPLGKMLRELDPKFSYETHDAKSLTDLAAKDSGVVVRQVVGPVTGIKLKDGLAIRIAARS